MVKRMTVAFVTGVERGRGNLGARQRAMEKGKELLPPSHAVSCPQFPSPSLSNFCHAG